ncbi:hypothetical protein [Rhodopseudomonas palustris]|uniref:Flavoprotein domain-containing protein n=1 Tax=Rhodopseudomonas palustris (strain BisB18) TaxID=316056 RepID=Q21A52_RHOPB
MTREQLEASIAEAIIGCLADRVVAAMQARQKRAVVLMTGTDLGLDHIPQALGCLRENGWTLRFALSLQARRHFGAGQLLALGIDVVADTATDLDVLLDGCGSLLVPALTMTTAAKVACGIRDSLASRLMARALERGLPIIAAFDGCCPDNPERQARGFLVADAYKARLRANLQALRDYGVRLVPARKLAVAAQRAITPATAIGTQATGGVAAMPAAGVAVGAGDRRIFSRNDAVQCQPGELRLGREVLVTPLAADELRIRNVRLIQT